MNNCPMHQNHNDREEGEFTRVCPFYMCCQCMMMAMMHHMPNQMPGMMAPEMAQNNYRSMRQRPCSGFIYTVRVGDTLYAIAQRYRVTVNAILRANPQITNPNVLNAGMEICIPGVTPLPQPVECPDGQLYTVRAGDTLYTIARRFNLTVAEVLEANPFITNPNRLEIGWNLCIPVEVPTPTECEEGERYVIQSGDTLYTIARRFDVTIDEILEANPLITDPNNLRVGQIICIPVEEPGPECAGVVYIVRAGDTLYAIARRYNMTINDLLEANPGIDPNRLEIGQEICIPREEPAPQCTGRSYIVRPGDTLSGIAVNFGVTYQALLNANPQITNPNVIVAGQTICIPAQGNNNNNNNR